MSSPGPGLNLAQLDAVNHLGGPSLVLAGAGSGKTRVITHKIGRLIQAGLAADRIAAITFTNKAAAEMRERAAQLVGRDARKVLICTFHALGVRLLREDGQVLGLKPQFSILDTDDITSLLKDCGGTTDANTARGWQWTISSWKGEGLTAAEALKRAKDENERVTATIMARYEERLTAYQSVDFDDLIRLPLKLLGEHAEVREKWQKKLGHVLVDEYQDTNATQYELLKLLVGERARFTAVGDDDQSIYGWRGAEVEHILRFGKDWPDARVIRLEWNYRSTAAILDFANRLIGFNTHRHDKELRAARVGGERPRIEQYESETVEAQATVADIRRRIESEKLEPRDFAILFRTNEQPRAFETELRKAKIPYVILGSQSFFDKKEVKDVLAYLKAIVYPRDEVNLLRIINNPPRGIGEKSVESILKDAVGRGVPVWNVLTDVVGTRGVPLLEEGTRSVPSTLSLPAAARAAIARFVVLLERYHNESRTQRPLVDLVRRLIAEIGYQNEIKRLYPDPQEQEARWQSVEDVVNALAAYEQSAKQPTLGDFIDEVALGQQDMGDEKEKQLARNSVALMTLHSAKGLEFPHVYMVGLEEGILPHHRSLKADSDDVDEERRLCYVGITRAQERLTLSLSLTRMKWGKPRDTIPSRFLYEIMGQAEKAPGAKRRARVVG
jgi:superfamily I DNA/RNA helicase